jgi:hypothetical protein
MIVGMFTCGISEEGGVFTERWPAWITRRSALLGTVPLFAVASSGGFSGSEPVKVIDGLPRCTSVEQVKFNHDAQLLAMISRGGAHTLKLVHLPSCSVSPETWPETDLKSRFPCSLDFSPISGLMAVGTFCGNANVIQDVVPSEAWLSNDISNDLSFLLVCASNIASKLQHANAKPTRLRYYVN